MLGLDDGPHADQRDLFWRCQREGDAERVGELATRLAKALLDGSGGEINVLTIWPRGPRPKSAPVTTA